MDSATTSTTSTTTPSLALISTLPPIILLVIVIIKLFPISRSISKLPPGPRPVPIFGNIFELGDKPHRAFARLAKLHGPLITLRLGSVTTVVVSSSEVAREVFLRHDQALSNRTVPDSVRAGDHHKLSMSWLPTSSPKWRSLRKISAVHLLSNQRLDAGQPLRRAKLRQLLDHVRARSRLGQPVDIGRAAFTTSLNLLSSTFFSRDLAHHGSSESQEFKRLMWCIMEEIGRPNYADYFPALGSLDPLGIRRRLAAYFDRLIAVFQEIIRERLADGDSASANDDVLETLLDLYKEGELSMDEINHLLVDIFDAGTDTTASTLEWAMAELVKHPDIMRRAQAEIGAALGGVGKEDDVVQESEIPKLPFLQAIIKETLRLHPPTVFLLPRRAEADVELHGYTVPAGAQVLVNLWAIGTDPRVWGDHPEEFSPDRFLGCELDFRGRDFEFLPFGAGRRICPGLSLAYRMLHLMLATLLQSFDWTLEDGLSPRDLDMSEKFGITLQKVKPLRLIPLPKQ